MIVATLTEEVKNSDTKTLTGEGYMVKTQVIVNSDGGDTAGYTIPFTASENGSRIPGTVSATKRVPTFTPKSEETTPETASVTSQTDSKAASTTGK